MVLEHQTQCTNKYFAIYLGNTCRASHNEMGTLPGARIRAVSTVEKFHSHRDYVLAKRDT